MALFNKKTNLFLKNRRTEALNVEINAGIPPKLIGRIFVDLNMLEVMEVKRLLWEQKQNIVSNKPLGVLAIEFGFLTDAQVAKALSVQQRRQIISSEDLATYNPKLPAYINLNELRDNKVKILNITKSELLYAYDIAYQESCNQYMDINFPEYRKQSIPAIDGAIERS